MAGFNLFNQTTPITTTSASPFGTSSLNTSSAFGVSTSQQSVSFGAGTSSGNLTFGTSTSQSPFSAIKPVSFGSPGSSLFAAPSSTAVTTVAQTGLSFGNSTVLGSTGTATSTPTKPVFGASGFSSPANIPSGLSFGATTTTASFGSSFNATTAPQTGLLFSTPATMKTGISFGTPTATTQTGISFGTSTTTIQTGILFGTPTTTTQTGILFGTPTTTTQTGISLEVPAATTQVATSFSVQPSTATTLLSQTCTTTTSTTAGLLLSFGRTNTTQASPFSGTSVSQTALFSGSQPVSSSGINTSQSLQFRAPNTSQPLSFGTGLTSTTTNQSILGSLSSSTMTSAPSLFGNLTATSTTTATISTTSSLFGTSSTTTPSTVSTGSIFSWQKPITETAVTSSTSVGLGGVDHTAVTTVQSSTNTVVSVKEQSLPNEIQQTVIAFKEYVKTQKNLSSEVARSSSEPLTKLSQQIAALNNLILSSGSILSQQKFTAEKIKMETIKALNDYELAQKIKDSPVASEERLLSIRRYFTEKISYFEESTKVLQEKIEYVYQHVITLPQENSLSADALKLIVKKLHDSFVVICARAYKLHNDMQLLKVQYLTLRNQFVKDNSSISFSINREIQLPQDITRAKQSSDLSLEGPNPFSRTGNSSFNSLLLTSQSRTFPITTTSSNVSGLLNMSKSFGFTDLSSSSVFDQSSSSGQYFNLQKPPLGNKRKFL